MLIIGMCKVVIKNAINMLFDVIWILDWYSHCTKIKYK